MCKKYKYSFTAKLSSSFPDALTLFEVNKVSGGNIKGIHWLLRATSPKNFTMQDVDRWPASKQLPVCLSVCLSRELHLRNLFLKWLIQFLWHCWSGNNEVLLRTCLKHYLPWKLMAHWAYMCLHIYYTHTHTPNAAPTVCLPLSCSVGLSICQPVSVSSTCWLAGCGCRTDRFIGCLPPVLWQPADGFFRSLYSKERRMLHHVCWRSNSTTVC